MAARASQPRRDVQSPILRILLLLVIYRVSASTAQSTDTYVEDTDRFPGWKGELPRAQPLDPHSVGYGEGGVVRTHPPIPPSRLPVPPPARPLQTLCIRTLSWICRMLLNGRPSLPFVSRPAAAPSTEPSTPDAAALSLGAIMAGTADLAARVRQIGWHRTQGVRHGALDSTFQAVAYVGGRRSERQACAARRLAAYQGLGIPDLKTL